jgi:hypothetical protein
VHRWAVCQGKTRSARNKSASRCDQLSQDRGSDGKWWVCDHPERPLDQAEIHCVSNDDGDGTTSESASHIGSSLSVELDSNNLGTAFEEWPSERAISGADIEDKITRANPGICNYLCSPTATEVMPPPPCPFRGHDAPF